MSPSRWICVFCGSSPGAREDYADAARALGDALARRGLGLVYGGARVGLMGTVADAALAGGAHVVGVIPAALAGKELAHDGLAELHVVGSMHERKATMADRASGFIAMPGGFGTFEELLEIITWSQLGIHDKPCGLLDVAGFFQPLLDFFDHAVAERFVRPEHRRTILTQDDPDALLDAMEAYTPPNLPKWLDRDET
ncbi:TIGR00730 family Rossman fold protein [Haliangium sp.]|uniref:LOG family protein n=1 Tax=Haliangium sp. TaxID=2663208 RepID=UPI003D118DA1